MPGPDRRAVMAGGLALLTPRLGWAQDDPIGPLVAQVSGARLRETVFTLAAFPTRWTDHPDFAAVENWVADAFVAAGADPAFVTRQAFPMPSGKMRHNIVVGDLGDRRPRIVVGAHMDTISQSPATDAPGANDNASGIAALLETCRILADVQTERHVILIAFAGEEQGLIGSTHAAEVAARDGWTVDLMLNLDMLGYRPPAPTDPLVIEFDQGNVRPDNDAAARAHGEAAARLAATHTNLATVHTDIWDSDYMPFEARGFPCIGLYDGGAEGPDYHRTTDTPDRVDYRRLEQVTRLVVAIVAEAGGLR